jgi:hypothetical protein
MRGFPRLWCQWMEKVVTKGNVCVQVNDDLGHFFHTGKGLLQGDPLSPILFNMVVDMLTVLIERAKSLGFLDGLVPQWRTVCPSCSMQMIRSCLLMMIVKKPRA